MKLYVNVPRNIYLEDGFYSTELFYRGDKDIFSSQTKTGVDDFMQEPISNRWLCAPIPQLSNDDDTTLLNAWSATVSKGVMSLRNNGGKGIEILAQNGSNAWTLESQEAIIKRNQGFVLDFLCYETENIEQFDEPLSIYFGSDDIESTSTYKWRLVIRGNSKSALNCDLQELNRDYDSSVEGSQEFISRKYINLIEGPFFNKAFSIWIQPLSEGEVLIKSMLNGSNGDVVATDNRVEYDTTNAEDDIITAECVYTDSTLKIVGYPRAWIVFRPCKYQASVQLNAYWDIPREIGYLSSQDWSIEKDFFAPDGKGIDSEYLLNVEMYNESGDIWNGGGSAFSYFLTVTSPDKGDGLTDNTPVLKSLKLSLPPVYDTDGLVQQDLLVDEHLRVLKLRESRGELDYSAKLSFTVDGPLYQYETLKWPKPNGRVQWTLEGESDFVRFDGYIDDCSGTKYIAENEWRCRYDITCRNYWKLAENSIFKGNLALDGMKRSEVYSLLAKQMGLQEADISVASLLSDDKLPEGKDGASLMPKIGSSVGDVLKEVNKTFGSFDRVMFYDNWEGIKLYVENPSGTSKYTFLREPSDVTPDLVIVADSGSHNHMIVEVSDREFLNEVIVIGLDKDDDTKVYSASYTNPPSWNDPNSEFYIGMRRTGIFINPGWNTQAVCDLIAYSLYCRYCIFRNSMTITSQMQKDLYPGDTITVDAGSEVGAVNTDYIVTSMETDILNVEEESRKYRTVYGLRKV